MLPQRPDPLALEQIRGDSNKQPEPDDEEEYRANVCQEICS